MQIEPKLETKEQPNKLDVVVDTKEQTDKLDNPNYILVTFIVITILGAANYISWRSKNFWIMFSVATGSLAMQLVTWYSINYLTQDTDFTTGKTASLVTQILSVLITIALIGVLLSNISRP